LHNHPLPFVRGELEREFLRAAWVGNIPLYIAENTHSNYTMHMKKRVHIGGLTWSVLEIIYVFVGMVAAILILSYLARKLEYNYFLSTVAIIITAIAGLIGAISLKRTIDTVRPFLTLTKTDLFLEESLDEAVTKISIRNTGSIPAEKVTIHSKLNRLHNEYTNREIASQTIITPTIFPNEERVMTSYLKGGLVRLIKAEELVLTMNITYQSANKKYYTNRTMNILKGEGLNKGNFPFNFLDTGDSWS
jgi:hypothetical protein